MLSETFTIEDVKDKLKKPYTFYDFETDDDFEESIIGVSEDVKLLHMYPLIGVTNYADISVKDKAALTYNETSIYWAEVYYICYEFLKEDERTRGQRQDVTGSESLRVEGYQYQVNNSYGTRSKEDTSLGYFLDKAISYMQLAGYSPNTLERTCSIFGTTEASNDMDEVLE